MVVWIYKDCDTGKPVAVRANDFSNKVVIDSISWEDFGKIFQEIEKKLPKLDDISVPVYRFAEEVWYPMHPPKLIKNKKYDIALNNDKVIEEVVFTGNGFEKDGYFYSILDVKSYKCS